MLRFIYYTLNIPETIYSSGIYYWTFPSPADTVLEFSHNNRLDSSIQSLSRLLTQIFNLTIFPTHALTRRKMLKKKWNVSENADDEHIGHADIMDGRRTYIHIEGK